MKLLIFFFYKDSKIISLFEGFINKEERIEFLKRLDKFTIKLNESKNIKKIKKFKRKI